MTDPIRSALKRLLSAVLDGLGQDDHPMGWARVDDAIDAARAALAAEADGPAVPESREPASVVAEPSDEELLELWHGSDWYNEGATLREFCSIARAVLARWGNPAPQPAAGEVAELTGQLIEAANGAAAMGWDKHARSILRAAELLQRQVLVPVPVGVRPWEREGWCDTGGLCWLGSDALDGCTPTWLYGSPAWAERFPNVHRVLLPAHALPLPEVGE